MPTGHTVRPQHNPAVNGKNCRKVAIIAVMVDNQVPKAHTMLLAFQAENARSFRDRLDFSLEATAIAEPDVVRQVPWRRDGRTLLSILPAAGVFGANASGKTNLLRAMADMRRFVQLSYKATGGRRGERPLRRLRRPFRLDPRCERLPSTYEIDLILGGIRYEYGFVVDDVRVISEWARRYPRGKPQTIFERKPGFIHVMEGRSGKARAVQELLRDDALFLSIAAAAEYEELEPLYRWFDKNFWMCDASSRDSRSRYTAHLMKHEHRRLQVLELLQLADLGITDASQRKPDPEQLELIKRIAQVIREQVDIPGDDDDSDEAGEVAEPDIGGIVLSHRGRHGSVEFQTGDESLGTLVWLGLIGPLLDALIHGSVLLVDELEASLHPLLVERFVKLFQSPESNPHGAQLIFNSHEARLLGNSTDTRVLGRDQAWFTVKLEDGSTRIYPLSDLNPRKSEAVARRYMEGRYGATPIVNAKEFTALAAMLAKETVDL
ncbi:ATP-binding protein [Mycobacterium riyadhense]